MKYKLLIILTKAFDLHAGGVQRSTYNLATYFKKVGYKTHVFSYCTKGHSKQDVANLYYAQKEGKHKNTENNKALQQLISNIKPNVVINQMPYEHEIGISLEELRVKNKFLLLSCLRNTLFTVKLNLDTYLKNSLPKHIQPLFNNYIGKQLLLQVHKTSHRKDLKKILDVYDYFVLFGPPNLGELKYFVGDYKLEKTHSIPNSILSVLPKVPPKEKRILWLSRLSYKQKRAELILPFWKKVMHQLPNWKLDIVGDGDAFEDLQQQIKNEKLPRVNMYGKQVPYIYYERSPIYIMTSENEGFPNTLIEAQSFASIPVVYDSYPICSWVIKDRENGILISPFQVNQMAKEVINLANNQEKQNRMMDSSLINARQFLIDEVGKKWIDFFDRELKL